MTTEHSTYTDETGAQETVTLKRATLPQHGHALLKIEHDDGKTLDCYVNTAWLRDRLNDLDPRPLAPDAITDEMVERAREAFTKHSSVHVTIGPDLVRKTIAAALTEPPARPEGAEDIEALLTEHATDHPERGDREHLADYLARSGVRVVAEEDPR